MPTYAMAQFDLGGGSPQRFQWWWSQIDPLTCMPQGSLSRQALKGPVWKPLLSGAHTLLNYGSQ